MFRYIVGEKVLTSHKKEGTIESYVVTPVSDKAKELIGDSEAYIFDTSIAVIEVDGKSITHLKLGKDYNATPMVRLGSQLLPISVNKLCKNNKLNLEITWSYEGLTYDPSDHAEYTDIISLPEGTDLTCLDKLIKERLIKTTGDVPVIIIEAIVL